tara:strand:+ start:463 stop:573 length:111 start_codon:yes stop_codon:yes gene_type:complete
MIKVIPIILKSDGALLTIAIKVQIDDKIKKKILNKA